MKNVSFLVCIVTIIITTVGGLFYTRIAESNLIDELANKATVEQYNALQLKHTKLSNRVEDLAQMILFNKQTDYIHNQRLEEIEKYHTELYEWAKKTADFLNSNRPKPKAKK
jgi:hypothetical protein